MPTSLANLIAMAGLLLAGIIHLLPLPGALGGERLRALYGVGMEDADVLLLLQHRAVLFGLLGAYLIHAAVLPVHRPTALIAGLASTVARART